jgi:hypothetical protein
MLAGIMRTIKSEVEKKCTSQLEWGKFVLPWLVRHCAWTLTRFKTVQDGHSAYFRSTGAEHRGDVVPFAEVVMAQMPVGAKLNPSKLAPR